MGGGSKYKNAYNLARLCLCSTHCSPTHAILPNSRTLDGHPLRQNWSATLYNLVMPAFAPYKFQIFLNSSSFQMPLFSCICLSWPNASKSSPVDR